MQALTAPASGSTSPSLTPLSPFAPSRSGDTTPMTDAPPTRGNFLPLTAAGRSPRGSTFILPTSASAPTAESTAMTNADGWRLRISSYTSMTLSAVTGERRSPYTSAPRSARWQPTASRP